MSGSFSGWLLDLYPAENHMALWLLGDDGQRRRFTHDFPVTFYAAGPAPHLRALWKRIQEMDNSVVLARSERRDVFSGLVPVLSATVPDPAGLQKFFQQVSDSQPGLTYYDADIPLALRYAARFDVFPLARCRVEAEAGAGDSPSSRCDTPWDLDPSPAPLRILSLEPDCDPLHAKPKGDRHRLRQDPLHPAAGAGPRAAGQPARRARTLRPGPDPDLLGRHLAAAPADADSPKSWACRCRSTAMTAHEVALERKEHTYFSYGQIVYRGGRCSSAGAGTSTGTTPCCGTTTAWRACSRWRASPASRSRRPPGSRPGTGISSMQFVTALQKAAS